MHEARRPPDAGPSSAPREASGWHWRWVGVTGIWALLVLVYSMRRQVRGEPFVWVELTWGESLRIAASQWTAWAFLLVLIIWIDSRLPVRRDALLPRLACHIPLSVLFTVAYTYLHYAGLWMLDVPRDPSLIAGGIVETATRVMLRNTTFLYWVIVGIYIALDYQRVVKDRVIRTAELEKMLAQARLANLRAQLHPHFLFNALNTVSADLEEHPRRARRMLEQLGELLRLSLAHSESQEITVAEELAFLDRYLALQTLRYGDRLAVEVSADQAVREALVPSFILQPIVENAVRYGAGARLAPTHVEVNAWREDDTVRLSVRDDGPGLPPGWSIDRHAGIGLSNTRERLSQLYGSDGHAFAVAAESTGGVRVDLRFPFRQN